VCGNEVDPLLVYFLDEAWFHLSDHVNTQNNRHWSLENPGLIQELSLYNNEVGIWCSISTTRITGALFPSEVINLERYIRQIPTPFFQNLSEEEKKYAFFQ
jgi:hypothetical protein